MPQDQVVVKAESCHASSALAFLPQEELAEAIELEALPKNSKKFKGNDPHVKFVKKINKLFQKKDLTAAHLLCEEQLVKAPSNAEVHYYYGLILKKQGRYIEADAAFTKALKLKFPYPQAFEARQDTQIFIKNISSDRIISRRQFLTDVQINTPTHYEYLKMSVLAYEDYEKDKKKIERTIAGELKGWELGITASEIDCIEHDYFAVVFVSGVDKHLVIAHRGSDFSFTGVWQADYKLVMEQVPEQFKMAQKFLEAVKVRYPNYLITHTGHSLGAALAELSAYYDDSVAITADSPGIKPILMSLRRDQSTEELAAHIITYVSLPNVVNVLNEHVGEVRAVFPSRPSASSGKGMGLADMAVDAFGHIVHFFDKDRGEVNLLKATLGHSLPRVLGAMDESTGYPKAYRLVKSWPHGENKLLAYENFCEKIFHSKEPMQDPETSLAEGSAEQRELRGIGYHTVSTNHQKMGLTRFTPRARKFLKKYLENGEYPSNINLHVLTLYTIENDVLIIKPDPEIFTVMDFKDYIELKLFEAYSKQLSWNQHLFYQPTETAAEEVNPYKMDLLSLPEIRAFSAEDKQRLLRYLDRKDKYPSQKKEIEALEEFVLTRVDKTKIEQELRRVKKTYNLHTICSQIVKFQGDDSIVKYLGNNFDFYLNKRLVLLDHKTIINANIDKVYSQKNSMFFMLEDGSGLRIELDEDQEIQNVFFTRRQQYPLFKQLTEFFSEGAVIEIKPLKNPRSEAYISPGRYILTRASERTKLKRKEINSESCNLNNLAESERVNMRKKMHSQSWRLENQTEEGSDYTIRLYDCGGDYHIDKIVILVNDKPYQNYTYTEFKAYENYYVSTQPIEGMGHQEAHKIKIRSKIIDENQIKLKKLEEIEEIRIMATNLLKEPRNTGLLTKLLDLLVQGRLATTSDLSLLSEEYQLFDLQAQLNKIHKLYQEVNTLICFGDIVTSITLDANYLKLIGSRDNSIVVFKAMQLLQEAFEHIRKLKEHELVMFWGKTGAGKSTALNYFAGVPLIFGKNKYGQTIVEVDTAQLTPNTLVANIGHSLGTSNTTYVQGYKIIRDLLDDSMDTEPFMLCDTPGFDDTRGDSYELAAMLSIQQAIRSAKAIRSIVLTVPYETFLLDRANPVIDLLGALQARIPDIFNTQRSRELTKSFFLLVTKHALYDNASETFEDMLVEFRDGEQKRLRELLKPEAGFEREIVTRKIAMWDTLLALGREHTRFIDIENLDERVDVLKQYINAPSIHPKKFANALDSEYLQGVLMQYIHSSVYTWRESIMLKYLKTIPVELANVQNEIQQKIAKIASLSGENQVLQTEVSDLKDKIAQLETKEKTLQQAKKNPEQVTDDALRRELEKSSSQLKNELLDEKNKALQKLHKEVSAQNAELTNKQQEIKEINDSITALTQKKAKLETEQFELSDGSKLIPLDGRDYRSISEMTICDLVEDAHQRAIKELRNLTGDECINSRRVSVASYRGKLSHVVIISKDFYIVPKDPSQREEFLKTRQVTGNEHYRAEIDGENYEPYFDSKASSDAKKIAYSFLTIWKEDGVRPWFSIAHRLPNVERNVIDIGIKGGEIQETAKLIANKEGRLKILQAELDEITKAIGSKQKDEKRIIEDEIKSIKKQATHNTIDTMMTQCLQMKKEYEEGIKQKQQKMGINEVSMKAHHAAITKDQASLDEMTIRKMHFAIIIKTQFKILTLLRQLSELVISNEFKEDSRKQAEGLYFQCRAYITYFDKHIDDLIKECQKDLTTTCVGAEELQLLKEIRGSSVKPKSTSTGSHFFADAQEVDELGHPISVVTQKKVDDTEIFYDHIDESDDALILEQLATLDMHVAELPSDSPVVPVERSEEQVAIEERSESFLNYVQNLPVRFGNYLLTSLLDLAHDATTAAGEFYSHQPSIEEVANQAKKQEDSTSSVHPLALFHRPVRMEALPAAAVPVGMPRLAL